MFRRRTDTTDTEDTESTDYISSEESVDEDIGSDSSDNEAKKCLLKRPLPWLTTSISKLLTSVLNASKNIKDMGPHRGTKGVLVI